MAKKLTYLGMVLAFSLAFSHSVNAALSHYDASQVVARSEIFFSPSTGTFIEGSTFDVPVYINTGGNNVNTIELNVRFDPTKLSIVRPSGGKSVIEYWIEPPTYNNTAGTVKVSGIIPNGIKTTSGMVAMLTFQAINTGQAVVSIRDNSRVLLNDGIGTPINFESNRAVFNIVPRPPEGVEVFSETHPFQDRWYNNKNPVLNWTKDSGVAGFSYTIDNQPNTIPDNEVETAEQVKGYENLADGLWYFHIKAEKKNGGGAVWGGTTHRLIRIDTTPPAAFKPAVNYLAAVVINRSLVSFFTTDSLSGMDHYEVGVIDKSKSTEESPAFFQAESPYQLPLDNIESATVIIRAFDRAGNVRDVSIDVKAPFGLWKWISDHAIWILLILIILIILLLIIHYLFGHKILKHLKRAFQIVEDEEDQKRGRPLQQTVVVQNRVPPPPVRSAPPVPPLATLAETLPSAAEVKDYTPMSNEELLGK